MVWSAQRRCHWYDEDGTPRRRAKGGEGCPRPDTCSFAHPWNLQDWDTAKPSGRPPAHFLARGRSRSPPLRVRSRSPPPRMRSPIRRSRSPLPRRPSSPRKPSRSPRRPPSPSGSRLPIGPRNSSFASSSSQPYRRHSPSRGRSRSRSRDRGISPQRPLFSSRAAGKQPYVPRNRDALPESRLESDPARGRQERAVRESSIASSSAGEKPTPHSTATSTEPGQIRDAPTAIKQEPVDYFVRDARQRMVPAPSNPPPPRAPAALAALTPSGTSPSQAGPSDRRPSDAAGSRWQPFKVPSVPSSADKSTPDTPPARELTAEEKEKVWFDRLDLINKGCALRLQCIKLKEEKRQFDTLLGRPDLIADEDRPVLEAQRAAHDATYAAKQNELERTVARLATVIYWPSQARDTPQQQQLPPDAALNLGAQISELKGLMGEVRDVLPSLSARRQDILAREEALRTLADGSEGSGHAPLPADITRVTRTELEVLLKKFDELEDRLAAVQNEIQQQHDDAIDEISALVAHKFEEMRLGGAAQAEGGKSIVEERLETAQAELEATGRDIDGLVAEVTELYGRIEQTTQENHTLKGENLALKAERDTLLQTIGAMRAREDERMQRVESGLRAVTLAMREHMARPTPPPFDTNMVVQHSQKIVTQHFRQELVPILTQLKDQVEQTLDNQNTVIWKEVIRKLQRTMEIMEGIQNWADRAGVGLTTVSKS